MNRKAYLKHAVYRNPLPGRHWIYLGALVMLVWAVWEGVLRWDAMDGMSKAYVELVRRTGTPVSEAIKIIWQTPDARKDWLNLVYLTLIALFSLASLLCARRWKPGFLMIPTCIAVFLFHTSHVFLVQALNLFEVFKAGACGMIALGSTVNIISAERRMVVARKKLAEEKRRTAKLSHGTSRTLIPERKTTGIRMTAGK